MAKPKSQQRSSPWRVSSYALTAALGSLLLPMVMAAAGLTVTADAAHTGTFGLEVDPSTQCTGPDVATLSGQTVTGTQAYSACRMLVVASGFVVTETGDASLTAGERIVLADGFRVEEGGSFVAKIDQSLPRRAFVQDNTPSSERTFNAQFFLNLNGLNLAPGDQFTHLSAFASGPQGPQQFNLLISRAASGHQIVLSVQQADGTVQETEPASLSEGWNRVAMTWSAAVSGTAFLAVNQQPLRTLVGMNTSTGSVDLVQWGIVNGTFTSSPGTLLQDEFSSWR